jgi:serine/threonine-protein kinase
VALPAVDHSGEVLDRRYRLERMIGRGAMADVYRAHDTASGKTVAVKILRLLVGDEDFENARQRFAREAQVQAMVRHRNVAQLFDSGVTPRDEPYIVVELLHGKSLRTILRNEKRVPPARATSYTWQALQGLSAVHDLAILHRDLKPANLMLEPSPGPVDRVVLIDFGFATLGGSASLTRQGFVVGSLTYLAPERLRGDPADPRSDVYAMGIILFELIAGAPPYTSAQDTDLIDLHLNAPIPPLAPDAASPEGRALLDAIIRRAIAKSPDDRYPSAHAMARDLEAVAQVIPPDPRR